MSENHPMQEPSDDRRRALEALEACRSGHDELEPEDRDFVARYFAANPEAKQEFRSRIRLDRRIAEAFQDVDLPGGLQERVIAALASGESEPEVPLSAVSALGGRVSADGVGDAEQAEAPPAPMGRRTVSRRWALLGGLAATAAAVLLLAVGWQLSRPVDYTGSDIHALAIEYFVNEQNDRHPAESGRLLGEMAPPADYVPPADVRTTPRTRWRSVAGFLGHRAVAYDLASRGGHRATLYVVRLRVADDLPDAPPPTPVLRTGGCSTAAWASGQRLFVLVVGGDRADYQRFLNLPRGPLT